MKIKRNFILGILFISSVVSCGNPSTKSDKSTFPAKSVKVIVPYSAGGGSDITTRALVEMSKGQFPKHISVENRTGGAGIVGMLHGAKSKADGYTVTMIAPELLILPHTGAGAGLSYKDFKPVLLFNSDYSAITVNKNSPYNSLEELIQASKEGDIQLGNSGVGSIWHLAAARLAQATDTKFTYIPYGGAAPAITDLLGGHIDGVSVSYAEVSSQVESGDLKVLAVLAPTRLKDIPNVPTAKELGYDVTMGTWRGLAVPQETPDVVVDSLYTIFAKTANSEEFQTFMKTSKNGVEVLTGKELQERMDQQDIVFSSLVSTLNQ